MPDLWMDGRVVSVPEGGTLLDAAIQLSIPVPTLCFHRGLPHHTSCMVCLVEDTGTGRLVPACATPAEAGMRVRTDGERVTAARRGSLDLLLSEHSGDCEAPCALACPAGVDTPGILRRLSRGDGAGALGKLYSRLPLPLTLSRICPAPCMKTCRRGRIDTAVDIRRLHGLLAGFSPTLFTPQADAPTGKRVAIVGAGPFGLSAAFFLARRGNTCLLIDRRSDPGGPLRDAAGFAAPTADALARDADVLIRLGVELRLGRPVSPGRDFEELRQGHDAVVLATGSGDAWPSLLPACAHFDPLTGGLGSPGLFASAHAAGARSTRLAVRSVAEAGRLAESVDSFLKGRAPSPVSRRFYSRSGSRDRQELEMIAADAARRTERARDAAGARGDAPADGAALEEARRCLQCGCARTRTCRLRLLAESLGGDARRFPGETRPPFSRTVGRGGLSLEQGKCIKCGICVRIAVRGGDSPGLAFAGRGTETHVRPPFGVDLGEALSLTAAECVSCCPTGALAWERKAGEVSP